MMFVVGGVVGVESSFVGTAVVVGRFVVVDIAVGCVVVAS